MAEGFNIDQASNDLKQLLKLHDKSSPQERIITPSKKKRKPKKNATGNSPNLNDNSTHTNSNGNALLAPSLSQAANNPTQEVPAAPIRLAPNANVLPKKKKKPASLTGDVVLPPNNHTPEMIVQKSECDTTSLDSAKETISEADKVNRSPVNNSLGSDKTKLDTKESAESPVKKSVDVSNQKKNETFRNGKRETSAGSQRDWRQEEKNRSRQSDRANTNNNKPRPAKLGEEEMSPEFLKNLEENKMHVLKKKNQRFPKAHFFCRLCDYHLDLVEDCEKHMKDNRHCRRREISGMDAILKCMPAPSEDQIKAISSALEEVYEKYGIDEWEQKSRQEIVKRLEKTIQERIPGVRMYMYGSSLTGFGLKSADINIDLNTADKNMKLTYLLKEMYLCLKDRTDTGFVNVRSDFTAKVPALLLTDEATGLKVNVAIHCYSAHCSGELLSIYADFDIRIKKLVVAFRYWAHLCGLDRQQDGFIPPQALNLMVIYFLQTTSPQLAPVITPPKISGEDVGDFQKDQPAFEKMRNKVMKFRHEQKNRMSLGKLWLKLLQFYSLDFDVANTVVCIRSDAEVSRNVKPWNSRKLAVEDPYMLKKNITRMVNNSRIYEYWQDSIRKAFHYFGLPRDAEGRSQISEEALKELVRSKESLTNNSETTKEVSAKTDIPVNKEDPEKLQTSSDSAEPVKIPPNPLIVSQLRKASTSVAKDEEPSSTKDEEPSSRKDEEPSSTKYEEPSSRKDEEPSSTTDKAALANKDEKCVTVPDSGDQNTIAVGQSEDIGLLSPQVVGDSRDIDLLSPPSTGQADREIDDSVSSSHVTSSKDAKGSNSPGEPKMCCYSFEKNYFLTDGKGPTLVCTYCEQEGHLKNSCPEDELPEVLPLPPPTKLHLDVLSETLNKVPSEVGLNSESYEDRVYFLQKLEEFIRYQFDDAKLDLFGSSCNGFGFDKSDIDICMTFTKRNPKFDKVFVIETLARILKQNRELNNVQAITTAKVPIVKFTIRKCNLEGDISLYNTLAQQNTKLLYSYSIIDPRVRVLGYTIKTFAKVCDIGDASRGSLSSYAYILMMLYYLQQVKPPVIPVLQELYEGKERPKLEIEGYEAWFLEDLTLLDKLWPEKGKNHMSVAELWLGFLRFYVEEFNYKELVVSIRQKAPLTRFEKLWNGTCIAIEDPFDLSHNLGSGLTRKMNNFIFKTMINGRMLYGSPIDENMEIFTKYQRPSDYFFDTDLLSECRPPNVRGCRRCGKIGHLVRHCPAGRKDDEQQKSKPQGPQRQSSSANQGPQRQSSSANQGPQRQSSSANQGPQRQSSSANQGPQRQSSSANQGPQRQSSSANQGPQGAATPQKQQTPQPLIPQKQPTPQGQRNRKDSRDRERRDRESNHGDMNTSRNSSAQSAVPFSFNLANNPNLQQVTPAPLKFMQQPQVFHNTSYQQYPHYQQQPRQQVYNSQPLINTTVSPGSANPRFMYNPQNYTPVNFHGLHQQGNFSGPHQQANFSGPQPNYSGPHPHPSYSGPPQPANFSGPHQQGNYPGPQGNYSAPNFRQQPPQASHQMSGRQTTMNPVVQNLFASAQGQQMYENSSTNPNRRKQ
ncbi:terminal uridylyltransferase 4-like [Physella acuta]|uniref:terminal uridylyltransferase 4-like n=1 Tax=Physella acuta TaxID=109671 RepID=UPI0027DC74FB|nr:terminal uridylyltransferase 4-like [Physella acuta]